MKLTVSNANITNTLSTAKMTLGNASIVESLTLGNVSITPSQISVGSSTITPTAVSVPSLILGGTSFSGGSQGGIINYQEFTANGTWNNPLVYTQVSLSQGLTYSFYTQGSSTNPTTEAGLDALFNTATSSPTVTFGGTGIHSGTINWGDATSTSGAGGTPGTKPAYLPADQFSWMVEGYILAPETGTYFFGVDGDDAVDVFVNGVNVASYYGGHGFNGAWTGGTSGGTQVSGSISLTAGQYYTFIARHQDGGGGDGIQVGWRKPSDGAIALIPASAFYYGTITSSPNTSLTGYEQVLIMAWGGGGGGNSTGTDTRGGGGGACVVGYGTLAMMSNTCAVTVGAGGTPGAAGQNTVFVINSTSSITAYGGGGGGNASSTSGSGGGWLSIGATASLSGGAPLGGNSTFGNSTFGGATAAGAAAGYSIFGGGAGDGSGIGGDSIFGGGGGKRTVAAGASIFGGRGGNSTVVALAPGGGGGGGNTSTDDGARGEVRAWVFGPASITLGPPTYSLAANIATVTEGSSVLYTVSTTNVSNGTTLYYTLNNSSTAVATDFSTAVNGSVVINGGTGTFTLTANNDGVPEENRSYYMDLRSVSTTGSIVANSGSTTISESRSVSYATLVSNTTGSSTYTFTGVNIGTAKSTRFVVVAVHGHTGATANVASCSIGGSAATLLIQHNNPIYGSGYDDKYPISFYGRSIAAGTTADITTTFTSSVDGAAVGVWAVYDLTSTNPVSRASGSDEPASLTCSINDIVICVGTKPDQGSIFEVGGKLVPTERYDTLVESLFGVAGGDTKATSGVPSVGPPKIIGGGGGSAVTTVGITLR